MPDSEKDPSDSAAADGPATDEQISTLRDAGEEVPDGLTHAEAAQLVDQIQHRTDAEAG